MFNASLVDAIVEEFSIPSLPTHLGKTNYAAIKEAHQLLTENAALDERAIRRGQNGYLGLVLPPKQYYCIAATPLV